MSHVLALLLEYNRYNRYNRDAVIKVYADDHLIDEMHLTADINLKALKDPPLIFKDPRNLVMNYSKVLILPKKIFLFEISEQFLKHSIRIEIVNDNNNYTNGFMSKYSWIKFHSVLLFPACLLHSKNLLKLDRFMNYTDQEAEYWPDKIKNDYLWKYKKGGSFTVEFMVYTKHKIVHLGKLPRGRLFLNPVAIRTLIAFKSINIIE